MNHHIAVAAARFWTKLGFMSVSVTIAVTGISVSCARVFVPAGKACLGVAGLFIAITTFCLKQSDAIVDEEQRRLAAEVER